MSVMVIINKLKWKHGKGKRECIDCKLVQMVIFREVNFHNGEQITLLAKHILKTSGHALLIFSGQLQA